MSVTYGGDKITFDDGSSIASGYTNFRNRIINGAMEIDQRYAGSGNTLVTATETFVVDRFVGYKDGGVITSGQSSVAPVGFSDSISWSVGTGASATSSQFFFLKQHIEGFNTADLGFGTVDAKTVTLSFWVRASVTGTYSGSLTNGAANRSYPFSYTINNANTWEYKTITVPGDTSGTWVGATNGIGLRIYWDLGSGSSYRGSAGSWQNGTYVGVTGTTSISATTGATFYITGVQLEVGSFASTFERRPYGLELQLCQRYYAKVGPYTSGVYPGFGTAGGESSTAAFGVFNTPVTMRSSPTFISSGTLSLYSVSFSNITSFGTAYYTNNTVAININASGGGLTAGRFYNILGNNDATASVQFSSEL
jgi:hypothetical protein